MRVAWNNHEHFQQVAEVYREALESFDAPTKAVAETFGTSHSTATKWVKRARGLGLLTAASPGNASGGNARFSRKALAVADALNVTPEQLRVAVIQHAGGTLRLR